jgi:hypothetical protein
MTSHFKKDLKNSAKTLVVYVRNNLQIVGKSWRIYLQKDKNAKSWLENILTMAMTIIGACLFCCIMAACVRCYVNRTHNIDFNVD